uniref:Uncharacterized protein n=1 Tax=Schistocephalus solidus TaxID=70667 RepID=A0A0X3NXX0_SCHSO
MISESEIYHRTAARPLSSISIIVDRLKSARLQDTVDVFTKPESEPEILNVSRRTKAVNFTSDTSESYWPDMVGCPVSTCVADFKAQPEESLQRSPNFGTNNSPTISESEPDDDSNFWERRRASHTSGILPQDHFLSASAPDGPLCLPLSDTAWVDVDRKFRFCGGGGGSSRGGCATVATTATTTSLNQCHLCQQNPLPAKRSCRSLSASSAFCKKRSRDRVCSFTTGGGGCNPGQAGTNSGNCGRPRATIARPVALRLFQTHQQQQQQQQQKAYFSDLNSPQTPASQSLPSANQSPAVHTHQIQQQQQQQHSHLDAQTLIASGGVKLRNRLIVAPPSSRLSWHHPIFSSGGPGSHPALSANQAAQRRGSYYPSSGFHPSGRPYSIFATGLAADGVSPSTEFPVKLRKPPSLACLPSGLDFSHHRISAFTPTQSRRISPHEGNQATSDFSFSPDVVSSPYQNIASSASSGFFQDSFSNSFSASRLADDSLMSEQSEPPQANTLLQRSAKPCLFSNSYGECNNLAHRGRDVDFYCPLTDGEYSFRGGDNHTRVQQQQHQQTQTQQQLDDGDATRDSPNLSVFDSTMNPACKTPNSSASSSSAASFLRASTRCQSQPTATGGTPLCRDCARGRNGSPLKDMTGSQFRAYSGTGGGLKRRRCSHNMDTAACGQVVCTTDFSNWPSLQEPEETCFGSGWCDSQGSSSSFPTSSEGIFIFGSVSARRGVSSRPLSESGTDTPIAGRLPQEADFSQLPDKPLQCLQPADSVNATESELLSGWSSTSGGANLNAYSVSPLRQLPELALIQDPQSMILAHSGIRRRKELAGLSEASEEEESNESSGMGKFGASLHRCPGQFLEEYDAGTLTPPLQTRFRPISAMHSSPMDVKAFPDSSTEGSPCSFAAEPKNASTSRPPSASVALSSGACLCGQSPSEGLEDDFSTTEEDESEGSGEDGFVEIAPGLSHRIKMRSMRSLNANCVTGLNGGQIIQDQQTDDFTPDLTKYEELDIGLIERD